MVKKITQKQNIAKIAIQARGVAADYGDAPVLKGVKFDVRRGQTFGLMGLNGAGKTTFIKILLGLMEPARGSIRVNGQKTLDPETKYNIAYLPEKFEPPSFLTGLEFVKFSMGLYNKPYDEEEVLKAADRLALDRVAVDRRVNTYSKGMRQKIGLIGTLLTDCPLMILDEPMSGLDPRARAAVKDEILACKKRGVTVFLSSHILADMDEICDNVAVIHDGMLRFTGTPAALKKKTGHDYLERSFLSLIEQPVKTVKQTVQAKPKNAKVKSNKKI